MDEEFYRIKRLPPYVFAEVNAMKAKARAAGDDIIDFGMGNPDLTPPQHVMDKLVETLSAPKVHRYSASKGILGLRKALAGYYERRFNVDLDPDTEVVATLGSKEGLANLAQAITAPGDVILVPNPSYPIHHFGFIIAGATLRYLPTGNGQDFMNNLRQAVRYSVPKPLALVLNYPSNPTAEVVKLEFYAEIVEFCKAEGIYILSDLAYAEIYFDDNPPPSILEVEGAKDIAVEFTSLSKTYSMAGWRMGFAAGNKKLIAALTRMKSYVDYGAFTPIQVAATAALNGPQDYPEYARGVYKARRDILVSGLAEAGWKIPVPAATMFAWCPLPEGWDEVGSMEFTKQLLKYASVAVAPGVGFGEHGEGFVRIAVVENEQRIRQAVRNIKQFMQRSDEYLEESIKRIGKNK
jgi:alanine-synthesizing transaminase